MWNEQKPHPRPNLAKPLEKLRIADGHSFFPHDPYMTANKSFSMAFNLEQARCESELPTSNIVGVTSNGYSPLTNCHFVYLKLILLALQNYGNAGID